MSTSSYGVVGKVHGMDEDEELALSRKPRLPWIWWIVALLLAFALYQFSSAGWIYAKANIAQHLIARSWENAKQAGVTERPWPWADTRAVARLSVPARGINLFVLDGTTNKALAFGPGHVSGTAKPGCSIAISCACAARIRSSAGRARTGSTGPCSEPMPSPCDFSEGTATTVCSS